MAAHTYASNYTIDLTIKTRHGQRLDFVLMQAENRTGVDYCAKLHDVLNATFNDDGGASMCSLESYGNVYFTLSADTLATLQTAKLKADKITGRWIARFNINHMLDA